VLCVTVANRAVPASSGGRQAKTKGQEGAGGDTNTQEEQRQQFEWLLMTLSKAGSVQAHLSHFSKAACSTAAEGAERACESVSSPMDKACESVSESGEQPIDKTLSQAR
jgi:hypothetical protein